MSSSDGRGIDGFVELPNVEELRERLLNTSNPLAERTRAIFYLRTHGSLDACKALTDALLIRPDSELLRHEIAYVLGQMQNKFAVPTLIQVLANTEDDCMVRHEVSCIKASLYCIKLLLFLVRRGPWCNRRRFLPSFFEKICK